jgi:hypothetical protein
MRPPIAPSPVSNSATVPGSGTALGAARTTLKLLTPKRGRRSCADGVVVGVRVQRHHTRRKKNKNMSWGKILGIGEPL